MRKGGRKGRSYREPVFEEDMLDLDEEPDWDDETDTDEEEPCEGYEEDYAPEEEQDDDDDILRDIPSDKRLLILLGILGIVILAAVVIAFVLFFRDGKKDREAYETELNLSEIPGDVPEPEAEGTEDISGQKEAEAAAESAEEDQEKEETDDRTGNMQEEISVGALDDEQDPQGSGAAGNETSGAEVTVVPMGQGEISGKSMGIDVSKYQGTIDWAKVKESGVDFAMVRVGYRAKSTGEIFEDPTARYNMQEAQGAGIKLGAYFFSSAVTEEEARAEAAFTAQIIAKYKITYPVAYNCEDFLSPDSRQNGLDAAARTQLACAFLDEIASAGYTPMFYASKGELEGNAQWNTDVLAGKYKIWVAQYPDQPYPQTNASSYSGTHDMWQYTSQGTVAGIPRKTDVNIAYFGYEKEAEAKDGTPAEVVSANPEVGIIFTEVNETVTAKQEINLRSEPSTLNDESVVCKLTHGDTATRTGVGHNGWSRVIYNGQTLYAVTSYLTTDMNDVGQQAPPQGPVYTPVNEQVTAKIETNLRTEPSTASDDTVVGLLHNGEVLTRTAVGDNGWSVLDWNGQSVYAVTSYLTLVQ